MFDTCPTFSKFEDFAASFNKTYIRGFNRANRSDSKISHNVKAKILYVQEVVAYFI